MVDSLLDWDHFLPLAYFFYSLLWLVCCAYGVTWGMKKAGYADYPLKKGFLQAFLLLLIALAVKLAVLIKIGFPFYHGSLQEAMHPYYNLVYKRMHLWLGGSALFLAGCYLYLKLSLKLNWGQTFWPWLYGVILSTLVCLLVALPFFPWYLHSHPLPLK